jgi:hypothetical protein
LNNDFEDVLYTRTPEIDKLINDGNTILDEGLRYGVCLYKTIYESNRSKTGIADTILGLMFREALEFVDGISILLKSSCVIASKPLVRTLFELYAQIKLMTEGDSENKAKAYQVCHIHLQMDTYEKSDNDGLIEKEEATKRIKGLQAVLNGSEYKEIDSKWVDFFVKKKHPPNWYNIIEQPCTSINALFKTLDDDELCRNVYGCLSKSAHGFTALNNLVVVGDQHQMTLLRHPDSFASATNFTMILLCYIYHYLIEIYLSKEHEEKFSEWFEERMTACTEIAAYEKSCLKNF